MTRALEIHLCFELFCTIGKSASREPAVTVNQFFSPGFFNHLLLHLGQPLP